MPLSGVVIRKNIISSYFSLFAIVAGAAEPQVMMPVEVRAQAENLLGEAVAGSEGVVSGGRLQATPILRPGEALEMVPGLMVTQHAGDGKANQYFLRGFNLDHGTDFAVSVAGVPVNMPTHAHGQGYADLNFLIPELVEKVHYRKGPYYAEEGDFASAGAAHFDYASRLDAGLAQLTLGGDGYARSLLAGSPEVGGGRLLYGFEWFHNDGPWRVHEDYRKLNGVLRYAAGDRNDGFTVTAVAYRGDWTSTDQVAKRALDSGLVDRFGSLDPSSGGRTHRYSLSAEWAGRGQDSRSRASAWWLDSGLDLWSNFQYCLNQGCPPGDQFKQSEARRAGGFSFVHGRFVQWRGLEVENAVGFQGRIDRLRPVGLYATQARAILATVREDSVTQGSLALWAQNETRWTPGFRSVAGLRGDAYDFKVDSSLPANSGMTGARIATPKLSLVFGPWRNTELYLNFGHGFHSNDARGATIRLDPAGGAPVDRVQPLVRTRGKEIGVRSEAFSGWQTTLSLWQLDAASELLFVGDAGTTEPSRPTRRHGLEWTNLYTLNDWLSVDADLSWSQARFRDDDPAGKRVPGAATTTANLGVTADMQGRWFGAFRLRYFGPRPLVEDNSVRSSASALANLRLGYRFDRATQATIDIYNLFDRKANDIEYWYESRLPGEAQPSFDRHIHPAEPRALRVSLVHRF